MSKAIAKSKARKPVNLTLSDEAVRQGNILKEQLQRPSLSNVVEFLIQQAAGRVEKPRQKAA